VGGSGAATRLRQLTRSVAQSCVDEAAEVTGWPINDMADAVQPDQQQSALLDDLGNAVLQASDVIKAHCPTSVAFTPTAQAADMIRAACPSEIPATPSGRLEDVGNRLQAMRQAVETMQPALADFYAALNDDQKARFNTMGKQLFAQNH
jgi:hypothetical protein